MPMLQQRSRLSEVKYATFRCRSILKQNAKTVGDYYIQGLIELKQIHKLIGDVRGSGLFIGFEFVKDRLTLEPDTELANKVKNELRNRNVLVSTDGLHDNVIKSKPPLCFTQENVDEVIVKLEKILRFTC